MSLVLILVSFLSFLFFEQLSYLSRSQLDHVRSVGDLLKMGLLDIAEVTTAADLTLLPIVMIVLGKDSAIFIIISHHVRALVCVHQTQGNMLFIDSAVLLETFICQHTKLFTKVVES